MRSIKPLIAIIALICISGFSSAQTDQPYSDTVKVSIGEQVKLSDYVLSYTRAESEDIDTRFKLGVDQDTTLHILDSMTTEQIFDSIGDKQEISNENISYRIERYDSDDNGQYLDVTLWSDEDIFSSVELKSSAPKRVIASQGGTVKVPLTLENTGRRNQTYSLKYITNSSLGVKYRYQSFNVTQVKVDSGNSASLEAWIQIPETASLGSYDVELVAENTTQVSRKYNVEVKGAEVRRELDLDVDESYVAVEPGKEFQITARPASRAEGTLEDVNITVNAPNGWDYEVRPSVIPEIRDRYGRSRATITVNPPVDLEPGDYFLEVSAKSKNTELDEPREIRLQVREKSGLNSVGAIIMLFSLGLLVFVYRKFQRR